MDVIPIKVNESFILDFLINGQTIVNQLIHPK